MPNDAIRTFPWAGNQVGVSDAVGVVALLPGSGYTVDLPVLHEPATVLAAAGWFVQAVRWDAAGVDEESAADFTAEAARSAFDAAPHHQRRLIVAKSLGTFAAPWARANGMPGVWLTPLLRQQVVTGAFAPGGPAGLLVGGSADVGTWDGVVARATGLSVLELEGVNHALAPRDEGTPSAAVLRRLRNAVARFAAGL